eukprot:m.3975 g.3975  ORF g.3975 m.3975 type:complete len:711 (+) comp3781_c0_seq1:99-2231(+)
MFGSVWRCVGGGLLKQQRNRLLGSTPCCNGFVVNQFLSFENTTNVVGSIRTTATATTNSSFERHKQDEPILTANNLLSDLTIYSKYARYKEKEGRREVWDEIVDRNMSMHVEKFPHLKDEIVEAYEYVRLKRVLPSMRSLQFAGKAITVNNTRMFNCAFLPITSTRDFAEIMFLLLSGTGVGFSVQTHHVAQLPFVEHPDHTLTPTIHTIEDSIEGWAEAAHVLMEAYLPSAGGLNGGYSRDGFTHKQTKRHPVVFDFSAIRAEGSPLQTAGGKAPGATPLKKALDAVEKVLKAHPERTPLSAIRVHDIVCHLSTCVASGGIRRSALISLFSPEDEEMMKAKDGSWWESHSERAMANNSVVLRRQTLTHDVFNSLWNRVRSSGSGEPGIYISNHKDWGTNPCCEIALEPYQFCNLTEIDVSRVNTQDDLNKLARAAAFIGTLQTSYTNFHFLRSIWKETTDRSALIGVSMTGIASGTVMSLDVGEAARHAVEENKRVASKIGVNPADRVTTVKPAGTTSLVVGTSSGVHAWHAKYYIRRIRVDKKEPIYSHLLNYSPDLLEDDVFNPEKTAIISFPQQAPKSAILRSESAIQLLERVRQLHSEWIRGGHVFGENTNNVSTTVSLKEKEWEDVGNWMWEHSSSWNGLCVLPYDDHSYKQAPFEEINKEEYLRLSKLLHVFDLRDVKEDTDETALQGELACAGGQCEVLSIK